MTPEVLACVAAAARAIAFLHDDAPPTRELAPPHPAFLQFRRMMYVWQEPHALQPIGDSLAPWLAFLRERQVTRVVIEMHHRAARARCAHGSGADVWEVMSDEGQLRMVGHGGAASPGAGMETDGATAALRAHVLRVRESADAAAASALDRALAILDSPDDGSEASDVAWPHFVLPGSFDVAARRLFAAACAVWEAEGEPALPVEAAISASVNRGARQPGG